VSATPSTLPDRLAELRRAFDASFARPPPDDSAVVTDLLAIEAGGRAYAVRLAALAGLIADRPVTRMPGAPPDLLGVVGLRGQLVPVYDLAVLVGGRGVATDAPRWLLLAAGSPALGFAVDRIDGHLRVTDDAIAEPARTATRSDVGTIVRTAAGPRPLIDLAAARLAVAARAARADEQDR
jgi:purine-binding chemotaxis protein CheW